MKVTVFFSSLCCQTCCSLNLILCLCFLLRSGEEQSPPAICRQHIFRSVGFASASFQHFLFPYGCRPSAWFSVCLQVAISPPSGWTSRSERWRSTGRRWSYRSGTRRGRSASAPSPPRKSTGALLNRCVFSVDSRIWNQDEVFSAVLGSGMILRKQGADVSNKRVPFCENRVEFPRRS